MNALRQSEVNGGPARNGARLAAECDDGLYRYVPVPPVFRDAEGYPVEDGMSQNERFVTHPSRLFVLSSTLLP